MKKNLIISVIILSFLSTPCLAASHKHGNYYYDIYDIAPVEQQYMPIDTPSYVEPAPPPPRREVVVRNKYDGVNTAANVITAIASMITAITILAR